MTDKIADGVALERLSPWARGVFDSLSDWDHGRRGQWSTWAGGDLMLVITTGPTGIPCEPVAVSTPDQSMLLTMRNYQLQLPLEGQSLADAVADLKTIVSRWFAGEVIVAAFFVKTDWAGSVLLSARHDKDMLGAAYELVRNRAAGAAGIDTLTLQTPFRERDQSLAIAVDGKLVGAQA
jgi:hypothetical protein